MIAKKRTKSDAASGETTALLGLLADIRAAVGDPTGTLMQDELVQHCRDLWAAAQNSRKAPAPAPAPITDYTHIAI